MSKRAEYLDPQAEAVEEFFDSVLAQSVGDAGESILDSAGSANIKNTSKEVLKDSSIKIPAPVEAAMDAMPDDERHRVLDAVQFGMNIFRQEHGVYPTADVVMAALQQGVSASKRLDQHGRVLDSVGSTEHHDQLSAQPNRIIVAITSAIGEAMPWANYLPTDIGSNEARLGIVTHQAGNTLGGYTQGEIMDGVNIGKAYLNAERRITLTGDVDRDDYDGKFTTTVGGSTGLKVLRARTIIFVNGFPCAYEQANTSASVANSPIAGSINIASTEYVISGYVTVASGEVHLDIAPAFPSGTVVEAEGFIDYELQPELTPKIITQVSTYSLFATPWRALADQTIDSKTQYGNELGLDLQSENLMAIRNQFAMERHYGALQKILSIAGNYADTYDFDWDNQKADKTRARIWQDAMAVIGVTDQKMSERTMDHGISHMYVTKNVAAQLQSLPSDIFQSSGIQVRPSIFRVGRLFGRYEVYYTPKLLTETSTSSQILAIGRSSQVARCPIVLGDAVAPTYLPLSMQTDMKYRQGFYARNFTSVNPHQPSAAGCALINITNM